MEENLFNLNNKDFWIILERFVINLVFLFLLVRVVYYRYSQKRRYLFGYMLMGIVIFFVGSMLKHIELGISGAVGLFAIFTILNLRTRNFNVKDMAYLFAIIAISAINSIDLGKDFPLLGVLIFNTIIILSAWALEEYVVNKKSDTHSITYRNIELLKPENHEELIKDVTQLTGQKVQNVRIRKVNYKKGTATLDISYKT